MFRATISRAPLGGNIGTQIENDGVPGTVSGNDIVYGAGGDTILAAAGNDHIDGGGGVDTIDLTLAGSGGSVVDLDIGGGGVAVSVSTGLDTLASIENVKGSAGADYIAGDFDRQRSRRISMATTTFRAEAATIISMAALASTP